eukprot:scaffold1903_cov396-Prasinococcus_capsulatus_cf.AAC.24
MPGVRSSAWRPNLFPTYALARRPVCTSCDRCGHVTSLVSWRRNWLSYDSAFQLSPQDRRRSQHRAPLSSQGWARGHGYSYGCYGGKYKVRRRDQRDSMGLHTTPRRGPARPCPAHRRTKTHAAPWGGWPRATARSTSSLRRLMLSSTPRARARAGPTRPCSPGREGKGMRLRRDDNSVLPKWRFGGDESA